MFVSSKLYLEQKFQLLWKTQYSIKKTEIVSTKKFKITKK